MELYVSFGRDNQQKQNHGRARQEFGDNKEGKYPAERISNKQAATLRYRCRDNKYRCDFMPQQRGLDDPRLYTN